MDISSGQDGRQSEEVQNDIWGTAVLVMRKNGFSLNLIKLSIFDERSSPLPSWILGTSSHSPEYLYLDFSCYIDVQWLTILVLCASFLL
jgi:hypothetical protein